MLRGGCFLGAIVVCLGVSASAQPREVFAFVQANCAACHNSNVKTADLELASLQNANTFEADREVWTNVLEKLKVGQMPPAGMPKTA